MSSQIERLTELLGTYKAEWLSGKIFQYFTEPTYFAKLKGLRPCILQGGRGTGKTTVLRGLSYQGQYALNGNNLDILDQQDFIGIFHRANTNHARAFTGKLLTDDQWLKLFSHYLNLILCKEIIYFVNWHKTKRPLDETLDTNSCQIIAKTLCISDEIENSTELQESIEKSIYSFQTCINNLNPQKLPETSMYGMPIQVITDKCVGLSQFAEKKFYILIDEYENFSDSQQQLLNTLIKHNGEHYTFKIGVRELGWRVKYTLNNNELLNDPADYTLIEIEQSLLENNRFGQFAKRVCQPRVDALLKECSETYTSIDIESLLPAVSIEEESELLKIDDCSLMKLYSELEVIPEELESKSKLFKLFLAYWAKAHDISLEDIITDYCANARKWETQYSNYNYSLLFKIRTGRGKGGVQKYYAGWGTYLKLANGNIRYLLELVCCAFERHINEGNNIISPISVYNQTIAAKEVGRKNLSELEGLWKNGAKLTKVLIGIGRILNVFAKNDTVKLAPEITQFEIKQPVLSENMEILQAGVMNLAFARMTANKLSSDTDTKDYMYMIHPIYAPFFGYSFRKKRKMTFSNEEFSGLINDPDKYIQSILSSKKIVIEDGDIIAQPSQLLLFDN